MSKTPFIFDKHEVERLIKYDLKLLGNMKSAFNYVFGKLMLLDYHFDLGINSRPEFQTLRLREGKNYQWFCMSIGDIQGSTEFIVRKYGMHLTVFTKLTETKHGYPEHTYGCFTFHTNRDKMTTLERETYELGENDFHDFELAFPHILRLVTEDKMHSLWNDRELPRPSYVDVETGLYGETMPHIDNLIFCAEELSAIYVELFAENDMLDILKSLPSDIIGKDFDNQYRIAEIRTEFPKQYCDPYYHGVGLLLRDKRDEIRTSFQDVYSLTRYHLETVQLLLAKT